MSEFTIICNILLFIGCFKLFGNWEVPIKLGFDPFKVVGGFPTLVDSFFEELDEKSSNFLSEDVQEPIVKSGISRTSNWKCGILESENQCFSLLTSSECLETSQFSFTFWENSEFSDCFHRLKGSIECKIPFQRGNLCENVVIGIHKIGNSSVFELDDVPIDTQISQKYNEKPIDNRAKLERNSTENEINQCENYTVPEMVLAGGENGTEIFTIFPFGINRTQLAENSSDCSPPFPDGIFLCNCKNSPNCQVRIVNLTPNGTFCGSTKVSIYHWHGYIYSAFVTSSSLEDVMKSSESLSLSFFNLQPIRPTSKFDLQRGRFHCPSETTCILEVLYPFSFFNSLEISHQLGILVFSALLGIVIINMRPK